MLDLIIHGATIIDGSGEPGYVADVGIAQDRIEAIGNLPLDHAAVIDAAGLVCSPGFIDMHSHTDLAFFQPSPPQAKILQGVTTELLGQDGLGLAPVQTQNIPVLAGLIAGLNGMISEQEWTWRTFDDYLQALDRRPLPSNTACLVSHGPIRLAAMGMTEREASPAELDDMGQMVHDAMQSGAFGFSTGLIYPPCSYAPTPELVALNLRVAERDGIFVVHQRDEGHHLSRSFDEVCEVSRQSGARLHISHLQAYGKVNWPIMDEVLAKAAAFLDEGGHVTWDRYPYLAGSTVLTAVLPPWTLNLGPAALVSNLKRPDYRQRIHAEFDKGLDVWHNRQISVGWENIIVSAVQIEDNRWMEGRSCQEIADRRSLDPIDMVCDLLAEERLAVTMISFYGSDQVLEKVLTHPQATVGSDGIYGGRPHPRLFGAYPKFIRQFVMDNHHMSLEEAIRKITSFPAEILGLSHRGLVREKYFADLVLFDPAQIRDRATYEEPEKPPLGVEHVFVNGYHAVSRGKSTGAHGGRVLRK